MALIAVSERGAAEVHVGVARGLACDFSMVIASECSAKDWVEVIRVLIDTAHSTGVRWGYGARSPAT